MPNMSRASNDVISRNVIAGEATSHPTMHSPSFDGSRVGAFQMARRHLRVVLGVALTSIILGGTADLLLDQPASWLTFHVLFEMTMIAGSLLLAVTLWLGWWSSERSASDLRRSVERHERERDAWRERAQRSLDGLGRAIDTQFEAWRLTPTEREVALLLLKGYGHKEIAAATRRSERTVRQHAGAVYDKAGLAGRAELAAFFLRDLRVPERVEGRRVPALDGSETSMQ
jgi:DNA-binding CsgD family transcriptional regulator